MTPVQQNPTTGRREKQALPPGYYHVVYHDVSPRTGVFTKWMNSTISPQEFSRHLDELASFGEFVSAETAIEAQLSNSVPASVCFVVWFDDGFQSVIDCAQPECAARGIKPAIAVNSSFALRLKQHWRCQLSFLMEKCQHDELARILMPEATQQTEARGLWFETLDHFSLDLRNRIDSEFARISSADERDTIASLFLGEDSLERLHQQGWYITNHSACHPGITPNIHLDEILDSFRQCGEFVSRFGTGNDIWVIPFDYGVVKATTNASIDTFRQNCRTIARAFYCKHSPQAIGRMCLDGKTLPVAQIQRAINPRRWQGAFRKLLRRGRSLLPFAVKSDQTFQ